MRYSVTVFTITPLSLFEIMPIMLNIVKFPVDRCIPRGILCSFQMKARVSISGICIKAILISSKVARYLCFHCCCVQSLVVLKKVVTIKFGKRDDIRGFLHVNIKTLCMLQCRLWLLWGILLSWELEFHFFSPSFLMFSSISSFQSSSTSVPD